MVSNRWFAALFVVVGLVVPATAQDAVTLQWKFEKGKPFYQEMTTDTKQDMTVMGMKINQTQKQTFIFSWTPVDEKDGNWTIKQKIEGLKMDIQIGGTPITYDSTKDANAANPLADFFKALIGAEFTITLDKNMKVTKVEGRDEFLKKLQNANPQMDQLLRQILSDDALKQMADPAFAVVPDKAVKKGDTWKRESKLNMGPIGTYDSTYTYTYEGQDDKDKNLAKIKIDTALKYTPPAAGVAGAGLPFKIKGADLKSKDATGNAVFDMAKGRLVSMNLGLKLEGKLTIDIGGMDSEVQLNQEQKTEVKTSDTNPVKPAAPPAEKKDEKKEEKKDDKK